MPLWASHSESSVWLYAFLFLFVSSFAKELEGKFPFRSDIAQEYIFFATPRCGSRLHPRGKSRRSGGRGPPPAEGRRRGPTRGFLGASPPVHRTGTDLFPCACPALWPPQTCLACTQVGGSSLPVTRTGNRRSSPCMQVWWEALPCRSPGQVRGTPPRAAARHVQRLFPAGPPVRYEAFCIMQALGCPLRGARAARPQRSTGACTSPVGSARRGRGWGWGAAVPPGRSPPQRPGPSKGGPGVEGRGASPDLPARTLCGTSPHAGRGGQSAIGLRATQLGDRPRGSATPLLQAAAPPTSTRGYPRVLVEGSLRGAYRPKGGGPTPPDPGRPSQPGGKRWQHP